MQSQSSELVIGSLTEREETRTLRSTGSGENLRRESAGNIKQEIWLWKRKLLYPRHSGREWDKTTSVQAYADCLMSKQRDLSKMILVIEAENRMNVILSFWKRNFLGINVKM